MRKFLALRRRRRATADLARLLGALDALAEERGHPRLRRAARASLGAAR